MEGQATWEQCGILFAVLIGLSVAFMLARSFSRLELHARLRE